MQKGILASLFVLVVSLVWYGYRSTNMDGGNMFSIRSKQSKVVKNYPGYETTVEPLTSSPLNGNCGNGYCDKVGEMDWTDFSCCELDCGGTCLYDECISPRGLNTTVNGIPFQHEQVYTCSFPENYKINQWRLKMYPPNGQTAIYTDWQNVPSISGLFYAIGTYEVVCQGRYADESELVSGDIEIELISGDIETTEIRDGVIDGCRTTANFGDLDDFILNEVIEEEEIENIVSTGSCGSTTVLPSVDYIKSRLLGEVTDDVCLGQLYHSNELDGVVGVCCPEGQVCDLNCDNQIDTLDMLLIEQIVDDGLEVEILGDGVDNDCDGNIDCGETVEGYCELPVCGDLGSGAFLTQEIWILPNNPDIVDSYLIEGKGDKVVFVVIKLNMDNQAFVEVLIRSDGDTEWDSLGYIEEGVNDTIKLQGLDIMDNDEIYVSYNIGDNKKFVIKRYKYGSREDVSPPF